MQTMKEVLTSFKGKKLDITFEDGVMRISVKADSDPPYPRYEIQEVGTDVFRMVYKGAKQAYGISRYYRMDKVLLIGPVT